MLVIGVSFVPYIMLGSREIRQWRGFRVEVLDQFPAYHAYLFVIRVVLLYLKNSRENIWIEGNEGVYLMYK